jgi:crotonobetainyl-CoA:carnitine CoA-transferase CaiB-like acyl-CoA transferase
LTSHLSDLLVADFSRILAGPLCTMMLADAGARVVKVEEPRGDETRRWGPPFIGGESAYFLSVNRNKESVVLDLKSDRGLEAARRLIDRADVVVENFKPADRGRFGLEKAAVLGRNPRAILCSIAGFDRDDPGAGLPGYDLLAQAAGGMMAITGAPDGPPVKVGVAISDILTAHYAHGAILAALHARARTGLGDAIEVSLFGSTVASLVNVAQAWLVSGEEPLRYGSAHPSIVPYQSFQGSDRSFVVAVATDRHFALLAGEVLGRPELASDPRYATNAGRVEQRESLLPELARAFAARSAAEWVELCRAVGIPAALVERFEEIFARPLVRTVRHPSIGALSQVRSPIHSGGNRSIDRPPPLLGEHTRSVLEELGMDGV